MNVAPTLYLVRQDFESHAVADVGVATGAALDAVADDRLPRRGRVAVAVGSRGIAGIADVVASVVERLRANGAEPFVVPAMGSHGGGTPSGRLARLAALGVNPASIGADVRAAAEVVQVATTPGGIPLWANVEAARADAVVPVNRVGPHTTFEGAFGSGLAKMLLVGLGDATSARTMHAAALERSFEAVVRDAIPTLVDALAVPVGIAIVEDARHAVAVVEAVPGVELLAREPELLTLATEWSPSLPVADVDLLIVDEMGKEISGQGMDPLVTGRRLGGSGDVRVTRLFVRDLSAGTGGNAHGIGQADATTTRLVRAANWPETWVNSLASGNLVRGSIPPHFDSDREAIEALLQTIGLRAPDEARIVRIRNTLALEWVEVSRPCLDALRRPGATAVEADPYPMTFDAAGALPPLGG